MGDQRVSEDADEDTRRLFMKALLDDVHALEHMLEQGLIEDGVRRIGAEQEMFIVDRAFRPVPAAGSVLASANDERLTTELARFNLEANLSPQSFGGDCLARMERELLEVLAKARKAAHGEGAELVLCGILPTLRRGDLSLDNMTPMPRYIQLDKTMKPSMAPRRR